MKTWNAADGGGREVVDGLVRGAMQESGQAGLEWEPYPVPCPREDAPVYDADGILISHDRGQRR